MSYTLPVGLPDPTPYLLPEETLRFVVRRYHPIVLVPPAALAALIVVLVLFVLVNTTVTTAVVVVGLLAIGGAVLFFVYRWLHWQRTVLVITNRRLFQLVALGVRRVTVMPVMRQSVVYRQGPLGRALGFATVAVHSATGSELYKFNLITQPTEFRDQVTNIAA